MRSEEELQSGFQIGEWEVLPARRILRRGDEEIAPEPKVFAVLMSLAKRDGDVVTRDELIDEVWDGRPTGDEPINRCVSQLRRHLGDTRPYRYIKPVTGSGYQLQTAVEPLPMPEEPTLDPPRRKLWPYMFVVAVVAVVAFAMGWFGPDLTDIEPGPVESIVLLPCENDTGDGQEFLGAGFRDELARTLRQIDGFRVITGRDSYSRRSASDVGRAFGVDSVLRCVVQQNVSELKVSFEVSDGRSGEVIFADAITDSMANLFAVQERVAVRVRDNLLGESPQQLLSASRPSDDEAYISYLRGLYLFERRGVENLLAAIELFEHTIALDPQFGPAYLQLATATAVRPVYLDEDPEQNAARAIDIVEQGIAADSSIEDAAGAVYGYVYQIRNEWAKSELAYRRATTANIVDANAFNWYSRMLASVGRLDASLEQILYAQNMDPDNAVIASRVALSYFWVGDSEKAGEYFLRADELGASYNIQLLGYALYLSEQNDFEAASMVAKRAAAASGLPEEWIDAVLASVENPELAPAALAVIDETAASGGLPAQAEIVTRIMLDDIDGALRVARLLEQPGEAFEMDLLWLPQFAELRQRDEFTDLMRDLGVVEYWDLNGCEFVDTQVVCED